MYTSPGDKRDQPRDLMRRYSRQPSGGPNGLRPERRMDKNGVISTRWVKDDADNGGSAALASHSSVGSGQVAVPTNVNWDAASEEKAMKLCSSVANGLRDPDKLWENFDFYTGLLESKHSAFGFAVVQHDDVASRLREAWIAKHGAKLEDPSSYRNIGGDEGYQAYKEAYSRYAVAGAAARADWAFSDFAMEEHPPGTNPELDKIRSDNAGYMKQKLEAKESGDDFDPLEKFREEAASAPEATPTSFLNVMKTARERDTPAPVEERETLGDKIDNANDFLETLGDSISDRHSPDNLPEGGTTISWSDLNPFKRRKK